jgi:Zn-dependent protease
MLMNDILSYLPVLAIFLVSLTIHEYAHGWTAYRFGDDTAKRMGRLSLNPLVHISLLGTIIMPLLVGFGWAKPVPVNFSVLNKRQVFLVAAAGPLSNILMAVILTVAFHILPLSSMPLLEDIVLLAVFYNLFLAMFNLFPIPPLDGSKMVYASLKSQKAIDTYREFAQYGIIILIAFLYFGGFVKIILPVVGWFFNLFGLPLPFKS